MPTKGKSNIIPGLRYKDAHKAIDFLCNAFGFERQAVFEGDGVVHHAQLVLGDAMIMLGSAVNASEYGQWVRPPEGPDAITTMGLYVVVADCDAHHARATKGGARILIAPADEDYGGRGYTCRDLEGYVWSFGTYDPWSGEK